VHLHIRDAQLILHPGIQSESNLSLAEKFHEQYTLHPTKAYPFGFFAKYFPKFLSGENKIG
jgi:hypothetical protein